MENLEVRAKSFTIKWVNATAGADIMWEVKPLKRSINLGIYRSNKNDIHSSKSQTPVSLNSSNINQGSSPALTSRSAPGLAGTPGSENITLDEVNQVPKKLFGVYKQQNMKESTDSLNSISTNNNSNSNTTINGNSSTSDLGSEAPHNGSSASVNGHRMSVSAPSRKRSESLSSNKNSGSAALEEKMDKYLVREDWIGKIEGDELKMGTFHVKVEGLYAFVFDNTFSRHKAKTIMFNQYIENGDNEHASLPKRPPQ
ncbi:unnamed protein product [Ambrosiozyma monospora]|uniref:Unnamed protein product n=1 Tax=Ambrosiozyma monospora TaxID=43982 RepID=A0A9W6YU20_AMBMO|nr:unnamed protein product [Ambrosiozyma monospora]